MGDRVDHTWGKALGPWRQKVMTPAPRLRYHPDLEAPPAPIGHNGGPPLVDTYARFVWKRAHAAVWKTPPRDIALFRLKRAEAAGVDYRTYMLTLLDTGRRMQAGDHALAVGDGIPSAGMGVEADKRQQSSEEPSSGGQPPGTGEP